MRNILIIILPLFLFYGCGNSNKNQKENIPQKSKNIYEGVETMTVRRYNYIDEKFGEYNFDKDPYLIQKNLYDIKGNLIEKSFFNSNGQMIDTINFKINNVYFGKRTYTYDENNNLLMLTEIKSDGTIKSKQKRIYNSKNQLVIRTSEDFLNNKFLRWEYSYNNFDSLETVHYFDKPDSLNTVTKRKYDSSMKMVEQTGYHNNGSIRFKYKYSYNKDNKLIKDEFYDSEGLLLNLYEFDYDSSGREIKWSNTWIFESKPQPQLGEYIKYDNNDNVIERTSFNWETLYEEYGKGLTKKIMTYDSKNRETERLIGTLVNKFGDKTFQPSEKYVYEYEFY
tara:strand:+ start:18 stop:1028 length:1011 start_codon:yes stop_codon:yes gene_type:complete